MCARSRSNKKKGFKKICNSETKCHSCKTSTKSMCFFPLERLPLHAEGDSIFRQLHQLQRYQLRFWKSIRFILNPSINPSLVTRNKRSHERISIRIFQVSLFLVSRPGTWMAPNTMLWSCLRNSRSHSPKSPGTGGTGHFFRRLKMRDDMFEVFWGELIVEGNVINFGGQ